MTKATGLRSFASALQDVVATEASPRATADRVASIVRRWPDPGALLTPAQRTPSETHLAHHVAFCPPDGSFSVVSIAWLPGQSTLIHDHLCWCVVAVVEGVESEIRYRLEAAGDGRLHPVEEERTENPAGSVVAMAPPGDIHRVANQSEDVVVSLHIYGANFGALGTSVRRSYSPSEHSTIDSGGSGPT